LDNSVSKNGAGVFSEQGLNFIEGSVTNLNATQGVIKAGILVALAK